MGLLPYNLEGLRAGGKVGFHAFGDVFSLLPFPLQFIISLTSGIYMVGLYRIPLHIMSHGFPACSTIMTLSQYQCPIYTVQSAIQLQLQSDLNSSAV